MGCVETQRDELCFLTVQRAECAPSQMKAQEAGNST